VRVPVLYVRDNGTGMNHTDVLRMVSFGHKRPENDDERLIGRFGVGFKVSLCALKGCPIIPT
jgi:HSP90 family molecular chaperone